MPSPWAVPAALGAGALAMCAAIAVDDATDVVPDCPFLTATGLDCPLCGGTRGILALAGGSPGRALDHNIALAVIVPVVAYLWLTWGARMVGLRLPRLVAPKAVWVVGAVATAAFWVARNLPVPGLEWLAATAS